LLHITLPRGFCLIKQILYSLAIQKKSTFTGKKVFWQRKQVRGTIFQPLILLMRSTNFQASQLTSIRTWKR